MRSAVFAIRSEVESLREAIDYTARAIEFDTALGELLKTAIDTALGELLKTAKRLEEKS